MGRLYRARSLVGLLVAGAAVGLVVSQTQGCSSSTPSTTPDASTDGPTTGAITIGMSASLTGSFAEVGNSLADGTRAAEQLINSVGGVLGRQVKFVIKDDQSDKGPILEGVIKDLLGQNVVAIMGPGASSQCQIAQKLCFGKVPQISAWSTSPALTTLDNGQGPSVGATRWFFRTPPSDDFQARAAYLFATQGPPRVGGGGGDAGTDGGRGPSDSPHKCQQPYVLYGDDVVGNPSATILQAAFKQRDSITAYARKVPTDEKATYNEEIADIASKSPLPDCLIMVAYPEVAAHFLNDLSKARETGAVNLASDFFIVAQDGAYDKSVIQKAIIGGNPSNANGMFGTAPDTAPLRPDYDAFATIYKNFKGDPAATPPPYAANAFDAAILVSLALQKAGQAEPAAVRTALTTLSGDGKIFHVPDIAAALSALKSGVSINYSGASGEVDFDEYGNVLADYVIWKVENDGFKTIRRVKSSDLTFKL